MAPIVVAVVCGSNRSLLPGSASCGDSAGMTSVPSGPSTSSNASMTAAGPPSVQPILPSEECTMTMSPGRSPSCTKSAASDAIGFMQPVPAQRLLRAGRRLSARSRNIATSTRFWQVNEQNLRLAFFETST